MNRIGFARSGPNPNAFLRGLHPDELMPYDNGDPVGMEWEHEPWAVGGHGHQSAGGLMREIVEEASSWDVEWKVDPDRMFEAALFDISAYGTSEEEMQMRDAMQRVSDLIRRSLVEPGGSPRPFPIRPASAALAVQEVVDGRAFRRKPLDERLASLGWRAVILPSYQQLIPSEPSRLTINLDISPIREQLSQYSSDRSRFWPPWRDFPSLVGVLRSTPGRLWLVPEGLGVARLPLSSDPWVSLLP